MSNIRPEFQAHDLTPTSVAHVERVRVAFSTLLDEIERCVAPGRERAIVVTKLQEASMFAVRGIAVQPSQTPGPAVPPAITSSSTAA